MSIHLNNLHQDSSHSHFSKAGKALKNGSQVEMGPSGQAEA
jgi:hypothetical protein